MVQAVRVDNLSIISCSSSSGFREFDHLLEDCKNSFLESTGKQIDSLSAFNLGKDRFFCKPTFSPRSVT